MGGSSGDDHGAGFRQQEQIDQANAERIQLTKDAYDKAIATMRGNDAERYNPTAPGAPPQPLMPLGPGGTQQPDKPMPANTGTNAQMNMGTM